MSLTDKVIKNTFYLFLSQVLGFLTPFILTPIIISYIGVTEFGIYALVLGFLGTFGLFDLSMSASFVKFISEHYNKKEFSELNNVINTGFYFYILFSALCAAAGFVFADIIISIINIPPELTATALFALRISLVIFFLANSTTIFISILVSLQKMYLNSIIGIFINLLNVAGILLFLYNGYGLRGILVSNLATVIISVGVSIYLAKRELPEMRLLSTRWSLPSFKKMSKFGLQMQVSRLSAFATEKYDEFLLGFFSALSSVTYFNLAGRVTRMGKFVPLQLFQQVAPVAAELNAKEDKAKLLSLFNEATKYLTFSSIPVFVYIFAFSDLIIFAWMGDGYEMTSYLIKILAAGQLVNLIISAPGNSIIPNLGYPKYLMYEGLISLFVNLILSLIFIKYFGIVGAAIGNTVSTVIASIYIYVTSVRFFKENGVNFLVKSYLKPAITAAVCILFVYILYYPVVTYYIPAAERISSILYLSFTFIIYIAAYIYILFKSGYLNNTDKNNLKKFFNHISPVKLKLT